ncbi:MAG: hypothetical protein AAF456_19780 [Planctomycetota bacterium]
MTQRSILICICVASAICAGTLGAVVIQDGPQRVTRVKRPEFSQRDWDGIYFENLFDDGLVGDRPLPADGQLVQRPVAPAPTTGTTGTASSSPAVPEGLVWSQMVPREVIEDEVKALQQQLMVDVTTPGKFKSDYRKARQSYSMLSMLFAVIIQYDTDDVRWKDEAPQAQVAFQRASANARVGSEQSYQSAKARLEELTELVRGGAFIGQESPAEEMDWGNIVDRSPLMRRLEDTRTIVKPMLSSNTEFKSNLDVILHEASMVAVIGHVLADENSDDGDDESYQELAIAMKQAAMELVEACRNENYDQAEEAFNLLDNSCQDCHSDWR